MGILIILAGPALGIAWLILEFKGSRAQRLTCGILALIMLTVVTWFATYVLNQMHYNAWYGFATKELVDETVRGIESGKTAMVLRELKAFQGEYQPTYENKARYVPLVEQTTERMKKENPQPSSPGDVATRAAPEK